MRRLLSPVTQAILLLYQVATATWLGFFMFSELVAAAWNATAGSASSGLSVLPGAQCWAFSRGQEGRSTAADQLLSSLTSRDLLSTKCEGDGGSCLAQQKGLRNSH